MKKIVLFFLALSFFWFSSGEIRAESRALRQTIWERLRERFVFLLPAGVNRAEISEIGGTTAPTEIKVIKNSQTITLKISEKTLILRKFGGKSSLSELHVGDVVSARGTWTDADKVVLETRVLRDISIQKRKGTFWGEIKSIDSVAKTFVLSTSKKGEQKVSVSDSTKIVSRREVTLSFADLAVGHRVRVSGVGDSTLNTIGEVSKIKDWSIPPQISPSVTSTPTGTP